MTTTTTTTNVPTISDVVSSKCYVHFALQEENGHSAFKLMFFEV